MDKPKCKLLVVEDNRELCDILGNFFQMTGKVDVCGFAHNGEEALQKIRFFRPDVVLLDLIMPKMDGLTVLERMQKDSKDLKPVVIVTSVIMQSKVTARALKLGARQFLVKPYHLDTLLQTVLEASSAAAFRPRGMALCGLDITIDREVIDLGATTNLLGYGYIIEAEHLLLGHGMQKITIGEIYIAIAQRNETTPECVENAIRNVVKRIHKVRNESYCSLMGVECFSQEKPPSNARFLMILARKINGRNDFMGE